MMKKVDEMVPRQRGTKSVRDVAESMTTRRRGGEKSVNKGKENYKSVSGEEDQVGRILSECVHRTRVHGGSGINRYPSFFVASKPPLDLRPLHNFP